MLNFALVGCGRISGKHASNLAEGRVKGARLVAVCDLIPEKAQKLATKYDVPWFTSLQDMMQAMSEKIDVVNVLTDSGSHCDVTLEVAKWRKHIVVEKPMAMTLEQADSMISACEEAGVKLFVVKQNRFNLPVIKLREALEAGRFGKLVMGTVRVRWCRTQDYYDQASWRGKWASDGGVFANQASHHVDLLNWMLGEEVESVFAKGITALSKIETEDTGVAIIKYKNGALGVVEATTATRPKDLEGSISLLGEKATVEIGGFAVNEMRVWNFAETLPQDTEVIERYRTNPPDVYGFGHTAYLQNVVDTILNGTKPMVDGQNGRKSLELITAIYESIHSGAEVRFPFVPKHCKLGRKTQ